jgi:elongation factor G
VEIECPESFQGSVVGNISSRRGIVTSTEMIGKMTKIIAEIPLAETFGYSTDLRSMTQGQGTFTMELSKYRPVPSNIQTEIIAERKAELQPA